METIRLYYGLAKPGIVYGNILTVVAAYLYACRWRIDWLTLVATVVGIALVIGGSCALNNYFDRHIDAKMSRTKQRALPGHLMSVRAAIVYGCALSATGLILLAYRVNMATFWIGVAGMLSYVWLYGWAKRRTPCGTAIGSISGSMPVLAGYVAVSGQVDIAAAGLFLMMAVWQLPHFYAIALYRTADYRSAGLPVWPLRYGVVSTRRQMIGSVVLLAAISILLTLRGLTNWLFGGLIMVICAYWLWVGTREWRRDTSTYWGKRMFGVSLVVLLVFSVALSLASLK